MERKIIFWKLLLVLWINHAHSSIPGISYMDPITIGSIKSKLSPGEDPCNPLYWYPRHIPDFCNSPSTVRPAIYDEPQENQPLPPAPPVLIPILPPPGPIMPPPLPIFPPHLPILPPIIAGPPPLPLFPAPLSPPVISISSNPYPYAHINPISNSLPYYPTFQRPSAGFVPGMPGLVSKDGGINIMPFSDAYADILEKHKNKVIRKKLHTILDKYKYGPYSRDYRNLRKYEKYFTDV